MEYVFQKPDGFYNPYISLIRYTEKQWKSSFGELNEKITEISHKHV